PWPLSLELVSSGLLSAFLCSSCCATAMIRETLRHRYPERVPVICVHSRDASQIKKMLVPNDTTGAAFQAMARKWCPWAAQGGEVLLCKGKGTDTVKVPEEKTLQELDSEYMAPNGVIYFMVEAAKDDNQDAPKDPKEPQGVKINQAVPEEPKKAKDEVTASEDRKQDDIVGRARRLREKHPRHLPVIIKQPAAAGLPALDKKLLIPGSMPCRDLHKMVPKYLACEHLDLDWNNVIFQLAGQSIGEGIEEHELMAEVYTRCVGEKDAGIMLSLKPRSHPCRSTWMEAWFRAMGDLQCFSRSAGQRHLRAANSLCL
ncbi:unnamed protein product, partial [Symbiodinium sp. CCMP2456]